MSLWSLHALRAARPCHADGSHLSWRSLLPCGSSKSLGAGLSTPRALISHWAFDTRDALWPRFPHFAHRPSFAHLAIVTSDTCNASLVPEIPFLAEGSVLSDLSHDANQSCDSSLSCGALRTHRSQDTFRSTHSHFEFSQKLHVEALALFGPFPLAHLHKGQLRPGEMSELLPEGRVRSAAPAAGVLLIEVQRDAHGEQGARQHPT